MSSSGCFATPTPIPVSTRALSVLRAAFQLCVAENPLSWTFLQGRWNEKADLEGVSSSLAHSNQWFIAFRAILYNWCTRPSLC